MENETSPKVAPNTKLLRYNVNGENYKSYNEIPEFMKKYFLDKDNDGIPDLLEIDIEQKGSTTKYIVNGKTFNNFEDLKKEVGGDFTAEMMDQLGQDFMKHITTTFVAQHGPKLAKIAVIAGLIVVGIFYLIYVLIPAIS